LEGVTETKGEIIVPVYNENPPVLMTVEEAKNAGLVWGADDILSFKGGMFFFPSCIDNPELLDYITENQSSGSNADRDFELYYMWGEGIVQFGDWVFHTAGLAHKWGIVLNDGKNKPYLMYGVLDGKKLASRNHTRPFKTLEEAEAARREAVYSEATEYGFSLATPEEKDFYKGFGETFTAAWNMEVWRGLQLLQKYKPEHGCYYNAALLLRARLTRRSDDLEAVAALYDEFAARRPEFADYVEKKKAALAKIKITMK
jgi:hypothetical protein